MVILFILYIAFLISFEAIILFLSRRTNASRRKKPYIHGFIFFIFVPHIVYPPPQIEMISFDNPSFIS